LKVVALALTAALTFPSAAFAQAGDMATFAIREDFARVAPAAGPAWWKVSKGDSVIWIMGAPPPQLERRLAWDKSAYRRRLKGARLVLLPYDNRSSFVEGEDWLTLRLRLEEAVVAARRQLGRRPTTRRRAEYLSAMTARLEYVLQQDGRTATHSEILTEARRSGAPLVRSPISEHTSSAAGAPTGNPQAGACADEAQAFIHTDPKKFDLANQYWAVGDIPGLMQATPRELSPLCRRLWLEQRQQDIAFQTHVLMEALRRPGKAVAVYPIDNLIAGNGILARLKAQGYAVADPSQPLSED
jgi:hypothetical protein